MRLSAGLLLYRRTGDAVEVLLAHPGGPYFSARDTGVWGIPKGEVEPDEEPLAAACREFGEETGFESAPPYIPLGEVRQRGGKRVVAWAFEGDCEPSRLRSNEFEIEWPPRSGQRRRFPEVDRVALFTPEAARQHIIDRQLPFLSRLSEWLEQPRAERG